MWEIVNLNREVDIYEGGGKSKNGRYLATEFRKYILNYNLVIQSKNFKLRQTKYMKHM